MELQVQGVAGLDPVRPLGVGRSGSRVAGRETAPSSKKRQAAPRPAHTRTPSAPELFAASPPAHRKTQRLQARNNKLWGAVSCKLAGRVRVRGSQARGKYKRHDVG
jgi:hypothetical protein